MELGKRIIKELKNNPALKDFFLFAFVTIVFHFLYWNTNMDNWLFGCYTSEVYDFFTNIAYKGTVFLSNIFFTTPFDAIDSSIKFYTINAAQEKEYFCIMQIVDSCSAVKQLLQFFMIMLVVPNKFSKRMIYFLIGSVVVLFFNIIRTFSLTAVLLNFPDNFQFIHLWVGRPFHYIIIFFLWVTWIQFFARPKKR